MNDSTNARTACAPMPHVPVRTAHRMRGALAAASAVLLSQGLAGIAHAEGDAAMRGLDQQVQEIKSDVLAISAELKQLEERLLYPSDTQLALFVSLAPSDSLELDSVEIKIDGEPVARHVYTFKEVEALRKGGIQRIHVANVPSGGHAIEVSALGTLPGGGSFEASRRFQYDKGVGPGIVEITLAGQASGDAQIEIEEG